MSKIKKFLKYLTPKFYFISAFIISVILVVLNLKQLSFFPWENKISLSRPKSLAINDSRQIAVVDNLATRVVLVSNKNKVEGIIKNSSLSTYSPEYIESVAMDDNYIYILDIDKSEKGSTTNGYRVLVYDYDCKYVKTLISDDYHQSESSMRIKSLNCSKNAIYATFSDTNDKAQVYIANISDGTIEDVRKFNCGNHDVYDINYIADYDVLTVLTTDGYVYSWNNNQPYYQEFTNEDYFFTCAIADSDNCLYIVDHNSRTLSLYYNDEWLMVKEGINGIDFVLKDYLFVSMDNLGNTISVYDFANDEKNIIENPQLKLSSILFNCLIWLASVYIAVSVLFILCSFIKKIIKLVKEENNFISSNVNDGIITASSIYGPIFMIAMICLFTSILVLGTYVYNQNMDDRKASVYNSAYTLSQMSKIELGNTLKQLNSQIDYNSDSYNKVIETVQAVCMSNVSQDGATDLNYIIYRFFNDSSYAMIVDEPYGDYRFGTLINTTGNITKVISDGIAATKNGIFFKGISTISEGVDVYAVFAPIYDSDNNIVGTIAPILLLSSVSNTISENLLIKFLELFTLVIGLTMVIAEVKFLKELYAIQKRKRLSEDKTTLIEIDRSLKIFSRIPGSICCLFITLLGSRVLTNLGIESNATLLALPLTVSSLSLTLACSFGALVYKYKPKKYIRLGLLIELVSAAILVFSLFNNNYVILIVGSFLSGLGSGVCKTAVNTIRLSGRKINHRYSMMVFCNMETGIATAISGSLGSVFRNFFGDSGVLMVFIISCLVALIINEYFVGNDINIEKVIDKESGIKEKLYQNFMKQLSFAKQPTIIMAALLMVLPFEVLRLFQTFAMPLINEYYGYPDVFIGIITFIIEIAILFFVPLLKRLTRHFNGLTWLIPLYLVLSLGLLIFALDNKMLTFVIVLVLVSIVYPIVDSAALEEFINRSNDLGLNANDTQIYKTCAAAIGSNLGPTLLSFMLIAGSGLFGLSWSIILLICTALTSYCLYKAGQIKRNTI